MIGLSLVSIGTVCAVSQSAENAEDIEFEVAGHALTKRLTKGVAAAICVINETKPLVDKGE
jgi:hypothetical protein